MNIGKKVLIIDSDPVSARTILELLAKRAVLATVATNEAAANEYIEGGSFGVVFLGIGEKLGGRAVFEIAARVRVLMPETPVVMMACLDGMNASDGAELASRAMQAGCAEFAAKPLSGQRISKLLDRMLPVVSVPIAAEDEQSSWSIVGKSSSLGRTVELAQRVAPTTSPILITGESGTGKELLSHLIHKQSKRCAGAFVKVNCAALNDSLLESELFGHEKGAFTGAYVQRKGRFEQAHNGTILLDEITETGSRFQAQLLRVLESQDIQRVGSSENIKVNVRIISTTNRDLGQEVKQGRFRADLFYRIAGVRLAVPALRERVEDIPSLVWHFVSMYSHECRRQITGLDSGMLEVFGKYGWPGNIRQLRNVVRSAMILGSGQVLCLADRSWLMDDLMPMVDETIDAEIEGTLESMEQKTILNTLRRTAGNQAHAARILGISDRTLRDKVKKYKQSCIAV